MLLVAVGLWMVWPEGWERKELSSLQILPAPDLPAPESYLFGVGLIFP